MSADDAKCSDFVWVAIVKTKTRLGQHFLTDGAAIERIVEAAQIDKEDLVVEIGPGRGALTGLLVERAGQVVAIEIDGALCDLLSDRFGPRLKIVSDDVRRVNLPALVENEKREKAVLVGNLPYHITGALLRQITDARRVWKRAVITVQREVGQRMIAPPGSKIYGVLSVVTQVRCVAKRLFDLPPAHFYPRPKVHSSVLMLDFEANSAYDIADERRLFGVVRAAFQQRRKMVRNALAGVVDDEILMEANIDGRARPETISIDGFERICRALAMR